MVLKESAEYKDAGSAQFSQAKPADLTLENGAALLCSRAYQAEHTQHLLRACLLPALKLQLRSKVWHSHPQLEAYNYIFY